MLISPTSKRLQEAMVSPVRLVTMTGNRLDDFTGELPEAEKVQNGAGKVAKFQ